MSGTIACQTRHVSTRAAPQDVAWALHLPCGAPIRVVRCVWVSDGDPAAVSTAYLSDPLGGQDTEPGQEQVRRQVRRRSKSSPRSARC